MKLLKIKNRSYNVDYIYAINFDEDGVWIYTNLNMHEVRVAGKGEELAHLLNSHLLNEESKIVTLKQTPLNKTPFIELWDDVGNPMFKSLGTMTDWNPVGYPSFRGNS